MGKSFLTLQFTALSLPSILLYHPKDEGERKQWVDEQSDGTSTVHKPRTLSR
jgi:hypothetical protein